MNLVRPEEVVAGVYQLKALGARISAVFNGEGIMLVDAGGRGSTGIIAAGLKALGASLGQVRLIVLTHYHPDHIGGLAKLVEATGAKVAGHSDETGIVSGEKPLPSPFNSRFLTGVTQPFIPKLYDSPVKVDIALNDGDLLPFEEETRVVHTPGHTFGSICLHVASKRVLIVGDALQYRFRRLRPPATAVTQDPGQARESLKKLLSLDFDVICFSHFPPLKQDAREVLNQLVERSAC